VREGKGAPAGHDSETTASPTNKPRAALAAQKPALSPPKTASATPTRTQTGIIVRVVHKDAARAGRTYSARPLRLGDLRNLLP
jgi:hypothetical protein